MQSTPRDRLSGIAQPFCALCAASVALYSLVAWVRGEWEMAAVLQQTVPIAPSTAILVLMIGGLLALRPLAHDRFSYRVFSAIIATSAATAALLVIVQSAGGYGSPWERWLMGEDALVRGIPVGRMSIFTASLFLLNALSLLALDPASNRRQSVRASGMIASLLGGGFALFTVLAYVTGTPLFYDGSIVPMALLTAIAFLALNASLLISNQSAEAIRSVLFGDHAASATPAPSLRQRRLFIAITLAGLAIVTASASLYLRSEQARQKATVATELREIVDLKVSQITAWREERIRDARLLMRVPYLARSVESLDTSPGDATLVADLKAWMEQIATTHEFNSVALFDSHLRLLVAVPNVGAATHADNSAAIRAAIDSADVVFGDFRQKPDGSLHLEIVAPILRSGNGGAVGAVMLCVDPNISLYPMIKRWPLPNVHAEAFLMEPQGDQIVYLSPLLEHPNAPLRLRRPLQSASTVASRIVAHQGQSVELGSNYAGKPVFGVGQRVPDSPWYVVAQIPQAEAFAPLRREASTVAVLTAAILCAGAFGAGVIWRRKSSLVLRDAFLAERARAAAAKRLSLIMQHASDSILLMDEDGRILEANDRALESYGYSAEEIRALPPGGLAADGIGSDTPSGAVVRTDDAHRGIFESVHRRKDGSTFPVEISGSWFEIEGRRFALNVCRDISLRKANERQIARLNRIYAALSRVNHALVSCKDRTAFFQEICDALVTHGGFKMAWVGRTNPVTQRALCLTSAGDEKGYLKTIQIDVSVPSPIRGPTSIALVEGRTYVCNDFHTDPRTAPWRAPAAVSGFNASISLPIREAGTVTHALTVYAGEKNSFGVPEIALLEEVAADVSFGLDHLTRDAAFRDASHRLATLVESAPLAIIVLDDEGRVELWNPAAESMLGWKAEEVLGRPLPSVPDDISTETRDLHVRLLHGEHVIAQETRRRRKDGTVIDVSASFSAMRDASGKFIRTMGVLKDITDRKRAESALRASETRFRSLFENSLDGFILSDASTGRVLEANAAACRMLGLTEDELRRLDRGRIVDESDPRYSELMKAREATGRAVGELFFIRGNGSRFEVELASSLYMTDEGPRTSLVIHDITERKVRERQIREQAALLDKANEAIVATDLEGRITYWNHGAERLFGKSSVEMRGRPINDVLAFGETQAGADVLAAFTRLGDWRGEMRGVDSEGRPIVIETSVTVLRDESGSPTGRLSISTDVTEQKKLEERFLRSQRLESIGMLAAGIAHDLNNVLAPISMAVPILRDHATAPADIRMLNTLERCAERGAGLARQILGFAHGIGGEPRVVQVKHLARDIANVVAETFPKSITLDDNVPSELWPVLANPTQVHQVLLNLCVNARDAMPSGGTLRLRAENCSLGEQEAASIEGARPGQWVVLEVSDTGTGIPPEVLPRIWEPFFTTKAPDKGTGLGLSTVRGIVETHRGFITVSSEVGVGTRFRIYLPASEVPSTGDSATAEAPVQRGGNELILVVDDEESIRDTVSTILTRNGYRVSVAEDGAEGAELFASRPDDFSLVISDLDMPKLDGIALGRVIRSIRPATRFLAMSGLADDDRIREIAPGSTAVSYLHKPFTAGSLLKAVRDLLALPGA